LPAHLTVRRGADLDALRGIVSTEPAPSDEYLLKVGRARLTPPPPPPESLQDWVQPGWADFPGAVQAVATHSAVGIDGSLMEERFEDDPLRVQVLLEWSGQREAWLEQERPARAAARLFDQLYELYGRFEREPERLELLVGDGMLLWRTPLGTISHP